MAMATDVQAMEQIGETAGVVWRHLDANGPLSVTRLVKEIDAPRDLVMQAVGWLAREDKLTIDGDSRTRTISLR